MKFDVKSQRMLFLPDGFAETQGAQVLFQTMKEKMLAMIPFQDSSIGIPFAIELKVLTEEEIEMLIKRNEDAKKKEAASKKQEEKSDQKQKELAKKQAALNNKTNNPPKKTIQ